MDDFKISLQAEIDKAKSKGQINSDINALSKSSKLKIQVDTDNITKSIQKAIQDAFKNVKMPALGGSSSGGSLTSQYKTEYQQLSKLAKQMGSLQFKIAGLDTSKNESELASLTQQLNKFKADYDALMNSVGGNLSTTQLDKLQSALKSTDDKINTLKAKMSDKIQYKMDTGGYDVEIARVQSQFEKWGFSVKDVKTKMESLNTAYESMLNANTDDKRIKAEQEYQEALQKTKNEITQMSLKTASPFDRVNLSNKIQVWLDKNSNASKEAQAQLQSYLLDLENADLAAVSLKNIEQGFKNIQTEQRALGNLGKSWSDTLKDGAKKFVEWGISTGGVTKVIQAAKDMYQAVYDVDTAMTNLYKVTDETDSKYNSFFKSACSNAKELGRSVSSLIEQSANWAKLGYNIDESEQLAKISSIYANVGEVDNDTAVSDMVTAMKAFNIEATDSITIVDSLNKLGNEFATDAASLGEGLKNSASALSVAGNDINQTLAILTGGGEITQDVGNLGNALKVVSLRLRGMKGELQEIGEEYEDIEDISKIQTQIYNLSKGKVNIFNDNGTFKSTYEQLKEISEIYFDLSDPDRAELTEIMFGKNRANQGVAILQAFQSGQIQKAYEASKNAAGSAQEEQDRWMQSLEAKTQQFQAAFQSLSNTVLDSSIPKFFVDLGTNAVSALDLIIDKIGILGTLTPLATGFLSAKGLGLTNYVTYHSLQAYFYKVA